MPSGSGGRSLVPSFADERAIRELGHAEVVPPHTDETRRHVPTGKPIKQDVATAGTQSIGIVLRLPRGCSSIKHALVEPRGRLHRGDVGDGRSAPPRLEIDRGVAADETAPCRLERGIHVGIRRDPIRLCHLSQAARKTVRDPAECQKCQEAPVRLTRDEDGPGRRQALSLEPVNRCTPAWSHSACCGIATTPARRGRSRAAESASGYPRTTTDRIGIRYTV